MESWLSKLTIAFVAAASLSGCFGGDEGTNAGPEPDPSTFQGETYDRAIGNAGFRVSGDLTAAGTELGSGSAAQLDVVDTVGADADGAEDLASFVLDAKGSALNVVARLRQMATADALGYAGDGGGGVGHYAQVYGSTGLGPDALPEATSYLYAVGMAQVRLGDQTLPDTYPIFVSVNQGFRDDTGAMEAAAAADDLEMHIFIQATNETELPGVPEGFLYYYFETVGMSQLSADDKSGVGADLTEPEIPNQPPVPVAKVLVNDTAAVTATKQGDANLTVMFDASESTDDGEIVVYVWKIFELNRTGEWEAPAEGDALASGQTAEYEFISAGAKRIELVVRDDRGGIASVTIPFWVDQARAYSSPEGNTHLDTVSPGPGGCQPDLNCFGHRVSMLSGVTQATFTVDQTGLTGVTTELYLPSQDPDSDDPVAEGDTELTAPGEVLTEVGTYTLRIYWQVAVQGSYTIDAVISYAPAELPEPGVPVGDDAASDDSAEEEPAEDPDDGS